MSTARFVLGCIGGGVLFAQLVWVIVLLYMAYTKIDLFLSYLRNSPAALDRIHFRHGGPWGRIYVVTGLIGIVVGPEPYVREGRVSAEDISNFPDGLRRKLVIMWRVAFILIAALLVVWGALKVGEF